MRQVALHMVKYPHKYYKYVEQELKKRGESYESYCCNVFHGNVWGDDIIASVFVDMWNMAISIVSPVAEKPIHLFHNEDKPDVVIVVNKGGSWMSERNGFVHFSATVSTEEGFKMPGSKLEPITVLDNKEEAKQLALEHYTQQEQSRSLELLREVSKSIETYDHKIASMIKASYQVKEQKKNIEFKLAALGISPDKIKEEGELGKKPESEDQDKEYTQQEQSRRLELLRGISKSIDTLNDKIAKMIKESD